MTLPPPSMPRGRVSRWRLVFDAHVPLGEALRLYPRGSVGERRTTRPGTRARLATVGGRLTLVVVVALTIAAADLVSKAWIWHVHRGGPPWELFGGTLRIEYSFRQGSAFGLLRGPITNAVVDGLLGSLFIIVASLWFHPRFRARFVALGMLLGALVSSLVSLAIWSERSGRGHIGFIYPVIGGFRMGTFNLGDVCTFGAGYYLALSLVWSGYRECDYTRPPVQWLLRNHLARRWLLLRALGVVLFFLSFFIVWFLVGKIAGVIVALWPDSFGFFEFASGPLVVGLWILAGPLHFGAHDLAPEARQQMQLGVDKIPVLDPRPPLLFLRAHRRDGTALPLPHLAWWTLLVSPVLWIVNRRRPTLEESLLARLAVVGPPVALGRLPEDAELRPIGAARVLYSREEWQSRIIDDIRRASFIVMLVDFTDALVWELGTVLLHGGAARLLLVLPPTDPRVPDCRRALWYQQHWAPLRDRFWILPEIDDTVAALELDRGRWRLIRCPPRDVWVHFASIEEALATRYLDGEAGLATGR